MCTSFNGVNVTENRKLLKQAKTFFTPFFHLVQHPKHRLICHHIISFIIGQCLLFFASEVDCKTVRIFAYSRTREQSNKDRVRLCWFFSTDVFSVMGACSFPFLWGLMAGLCCCTSHGSIISIQGLAASSGSPWILQAPNLHFSKRNSSIAKQRTDHI